MKRLLRSAIGFKFFNDFILIYPVYTLLFKQSGFSNTQISVLLMIWSASTLIFEIPSGYLADRYQRKTLLILAGIIKALGFICWLKMNFSFFALGFILWGISGAMSSGTFEAFIYDELKANSQVYRYDSVQAQLNSAGFAGVALALILGGYLAEHLSYSWVLLLSVLMSLLASACLIFIKPAKKLDSTHETEYLFMAKKLLEYFRQNRELLINSLVFIIIFAAFGSYDEFRALIYQALQFSKMQIGFLSAATYSAFFLAGFFIKKFKQVTAEQIIWIVSIIMLTLGVFFKPFLVILLLISSFLLAILEVKILAKVQRFLPSTKRATFLSINGMFRESAALFFSFYFGLISDLMSERLIFISFGLILFLMICLINLLRVENYRS